MPKDSKIFTLFIASPSDIIKEKVIIHKLVNEWNHLQGRFKCVRIEVTDWNDAFPIYGERPQAIINEQIFDKSDFVVALFWTKFGSPTGVADSGTEEEILRAIKTQKKLLLYFSNTPVPPHNINTVEYEKVKAFKIKHQDSGLYKIYKSDVDFKKKFQNDLSAFMVDLIDGNSLKNAWPV
jgi:hypothetical protein